MFINEALNQKWAAVLDHPDLAPITDPHKRAITAIMLENTDRELGGYAHMAPGSQNLFETPIPVNFMGNVIFNSWHGWHQYFRSCFDFIGSAFSSEFNFL